MFTEPALLDLLRTGVFMVAGAFAFAFSLWLVLRVLGFPFSKIRGKLDDDSQAIAILFAGVAVGLGIMYGGIFH